MPINSSSSELRMARARAAIQHYIDANGLTLSELAALSGVAQPQISKILTGVRKRWSSDIEKLCQYAKIDIPSSRPAIASEQRLSRALRRALGNLDDARAMDIMTRVVEALTPALAALRAGSTQEPPRDHRE